MRNESIFVFNTLEDGNLYRSQPHSNAFNFNVNVEYKMEFIIFFFSFFLSNDTHTHHQNGFVDLVIMQTHRRINDHSVWCHHIIVEQNRKQKKKNEISTLNMYVSSTSKRMSSVCVYSTFYTYFVIFVLLHGIKTKLMENYEVKFVWGRGVRFSAFIV